MHKVEDNQINSMHDINASTYYTHDSALLNNTLEPQLIILYSYNGLC
jgi:hypothetical protein